MESETKEIEITPAMIEAGQAALRRWLLARLDVTIEKYDAMNVVRHVYEAMVEGAA